MAATAERVGEFRTATAAAARGDLLADVYVGREHAVKQLLVGVRVHLEM